jgi:excisionase family DNA binding protein
MKPTQDSTQSEPILLTAKQTAARLNISQSTLRRWIKQPTFPKPFQYGSVVRWPVTAIDAFVANRVQLAEVA